MKAKKILTAILATIAAVSSTALMASAASASLVTTDVSKWKLGELTGATADKATLKVEGSTLKFGNTNGYWPESSYTFANALTANVANDKISYDFTAGKQASFVLFFNDSTPGGDSTAIASLNPKVAGATFDEGSGDIMPSTTAYKGQIALSDLTVGDFNTTTKKFDGAKLSTLADKDGNVKITAIKVFASGSNSGTLDVRDLSLVTAGGSVATTPNTATKSNSGTSSPTTGEPITAMAIMFGVSVLSCGALIISKKAK